MAKHTPVEQWASQVLKDEAPAVEVPDALIEVRMRGQHMTLARSVGGP